jgi:hypothetical protein
MRFAYADPPYLGCGKLYAARHPRALDWDDPDRHKQLVQQLCDEYPDGWAMSLSAPSLKVIFPMCPDDTLAAAWLRPNSAPFYPVRVIKSWDPVLYRGGRPKFHDGGECTRDFLSAPFVNKGLIGAKPRKFCRWVFELLGARDGDTLEDLFPGSGAVSAAWSEWIGDRRPPPQLFEPALAQDKHG